MTFLGLWSDLVKGTLTVKIIMSCLPSHHIERRVFKILFIPLSIVIGNCLR